MLCSDFITSDPKDKNNSTGTKKAATKNASNKKYATEVIEQAMTVLTRRREVTLAGGN